MVRRHVAVMLLLLALLGVMTTTLAVGRAGIPVTHQPRRILELLHGGGGFNLRELRAPRLVTGLGVGAALGVAGALFQRVTSNPLVTPDVIGITACAGAGTAMASALTISPALGAVAGAALAGIVVPWVTATGFRNPAAVIVAGIGVSSASVALTQLVLVRASQTEAMALASALTGSLTARTWGDALLVWAVLLPGLAAAVLLRSEIDVLALGDEAATGLGSRPGVVRTAALGLGIVLTAAAVGAAGPVTFVALTAPHLARWCTGRSALGSAALTGALVVALADLAVQRWSPLAGLPVGVVTALIGGGFLGILLISQLRKENL